MKILYLVTDDWYFLSHRLSLASAVRDQGNEVVVVTAPGPDVCRIEQEGFRHRTLAFHRTRASQVFNLPVLRRLTQIYRDERPDLVHHVSFLPIFYGSLAANRAGITGVVNAVTGLGHSFVPGSRLRRMLRWIVERAYKHAFRRSRSAVIFQNNDDRLHFIEHGLVRKEMCHIVPGSGVDTQRFIPDSTDTAGVSAVEAVILQASRMLWTKGVGDTVEASRILRERGVEHRLILAGRTHASNPESIPEGVLHAWEREGELAWIGHSDDMPALYRQATVFCLPSVYREGIPLALLEACASGCPVVTTDMPGCRDVVSHGKNGLVVPVRSPDRLADALEMLIKDAGLRARMGRAGRERTLREFSKELVIDRTLDCYRKILATATEHQGDPIA